MEHTIIAVDLAKSVFQIAVSRRPADRCRCATPEKRIASPILWARSGTSGRVRTVTRRGQILVRDRPHVDV